MKAKCLFTYLDCLSDPLLLERIKKHVHQNEIGLQQGAIYPVEAIIFRDSLAWYYLCDEQDAEYPKPYCSEFFELVDPVLPVNWILVNDPPVMIAPAVWAKHPHFLERLIDGDPQITEAFAQTRRCKAPHSPPSTPRG